MKYDYQMFRVYKAELNDKVVQSYKILFQIISICYTMRVYFPEDKAEVKLIIKALNTPFC